MTSFANNALLFLSETAPVPEQITIPHGVSKLVMSPVEHGNAVVVDEMQQPAELISEFSEVQLRNSYDCGHRRIDMLKYLSQNGIVTRQRVFQFNLQTETKNMRLKWSARSAAIRYN